MAMLLLLPLLIGLGLWQLERADQKDTWLLDYRQRVQQPAVALRDFADAASPNSRFRQVWVEGIYDSGRQILLDNQVQQGRPGLHVYTPLRLVDSDRTVLVNRGWLPLAGSRREIPDVAVPEAAVTIAGRLSQPANPGLLLATPEAVQGAWPLIVQHIDYEDLSRLLGYSLMPFVVLLGPEQPQGFMRNWQPHFGNLGPERHIGYAVQWFALALTLVVIYLVLNLRRAKRIGSI